MLQALFEYQSLISELYGMEFANSSLYDWGTSLGEAARMACRVTGRSHFLYAHFTKPERREALRTFAEPAGIKLGEVSQDLETGQVDLEDAKKKISQETAGVYVENPSYLGYLETRLDEIAALCHARGALLVVGASPISLGILKPPGEYGADIAVGEGQPLGNHMNYGGPMLGILAAKGERLLRNMPGRMIGMTTTKDGSQRAFCLALQTREQHIRREKATSNICSNVALCAVAAAIYLSLMGPSGLEAICKIALSRARHAIKRLSEVKGIRAPLFHAPHFNEFVVNFDGTGRLVADVYEGLLDRGIQGGRPAKDEFPELGESALYCFTEIHTIQEIDRLADAIGEIVG